MKLHHSRMLKKALSFVPRHSQRGLNVPQGYALAFRLLRPQPGKARLGVRGRAGEMMAFLTILQPPSVISAIGTNTHGRYRAGEAV